MGNIVSSKLQLAVSKSYSETVSALEKTDLKEEVHFATHKKSSESPR